MAGETAQGVGKAVRRWTWGTTDMTPVKATSTIVLTEEMLLAPPNNVLAVLDAELRSALALGIDASFLTTLATTESFETSGGSDTFSVMLGDIGELLAAAPAPRHTWS